MSIKRLLLIRSLVLLFASFSFAQEFLELAKTGTAEQVRAAFARGAKVDDRASDLSTPLMLAAAAIEILRLSWYCSKREPSLMTKTGTARLL